MRINRKGLTLLEVIISLAIIGILAVVYFSIFTTGFTGIVRANSKNIASFNIQKEVESELNDNTNPTGSTLIINLPDNSTETINGAIVYVEEEIDGDVVAIYFFKPFN